jgi:hypothetical protein
MFKKTIKFGQEAILYWCYFIEKYHKRIDIKNKNTKIPDLKRKFAEIEFKKVKLKIKIAELLRQAVKESK